jgi:RNA polymerase sigma factor (sigma-70 family)
VGATDSAYLAARALAIRKLISKQQGSLVAVQRKDHQLHRGAHFSRPLDVDRMIARYGNALLANARRHSANAADADDAYQRALEILLTKAPEGSSEEQLVAWLHTVVRNEALQIHRKQRNIVDGAFDEISDAWVREVSPPDEELVDRERLAHGREALAKLKPDQTRCLLLRADGLDYPEICAITGFSYAKVNRCLSEGRRSFRDRVERIDSGVECRQIDGVLSMIADGEAPAAVRIDADAHLKNCLHCQSTLRAYAAAPDRALGVLPLGLIAAGAEPAWMHRFAQPFESAFAWFQEKLAAHSPALAHGGEVAPAKKVGIALALSASLVAGGVTVDKVVTHSKPAAPEANAGSKVERDQPLSAVPIDQPKRPAHSRRHGTPAAGKSRATEPTTTDVIGRSAGTPANGSPATAPAPAGSSLPNGGDSAPASSAPGGSGSQNPDLAP